MSGATAQQKNVRFVLDWAFQGHQAPFTIPVDDGTFAKLGLNITVDRGIGSGDTVAKVASGAYDIGLADVYSMVRFNAANPTKKLIGVMMVHDKSGLSAASMKSSGLNAPKDLNGKRMASPVGDASRQLFPLFAEVNGIDQSSIVWSNVSPELREPMLVRGEVDAVAGHVTTVLSNIRAMGADPANVLVMPYADYGVPLYGHVLCVSPEYAEKNPEIVRNFIRGVVHGFNVMLKDPDAAIASIKKRDPLINDEIEKGRIKLSNDVMFITPNVLENGMSNVDMTRLSETLVRVAQPFEMRTPAKADDVYTPKYLPPREELKIKR
ncbi:ABC transporter substrate-binding protein [Microvirga massiliensis]|uniref:ABC transporter substrate-binding protein n=1 Tax=Microvirga massiliensis TaxID=1033741 RepID=UPI00164D31CB|nr:ABC transporter substrate-binding protein [Microvirga massiliensis]